MAVAAIGIDLDDPVEASQDFIGILALSTGIVMEHYPWRRRAVPAAVVAQHSPEISGFRLAAPRVQHRGRGFLDIKPRAALFQSRRQ